MDIKKKWLSIEEFEKRAGLVGAPGAHTHPRSEITDFWGEAFWANIPDKPATYPPSAHTHDDRYYTETELNAFFEGEDAGKKQVHWDRVTSKPETFTPSAHELTGVQHTASGLVAGHVIKATGEASFEWGPLSHSELAGILPDQHHARGHNILSADHPDSLAGSVVRGDIIIGNATPKWSKLGKGAEDTFLGSDGTDLVWRDVDWSMLQNIPGTFTPSAHTLVGAKHTASGLTAGHYLRATAPTTFAFQAIQASDLPAHPLADAYHTASGLIAGYVIRATGEASFAWSALYHSDLGSVSSDQHHPQSHTLASHSTKPHSALTGIGVDDHHDQIHASAHHSGGADQVGHDLLLGFVAAEHKSLPNTIAEVLSNHNVAVHNALNITQLGTVGIGVWEGTAIGWAYISKTGSNLTDLVTRQHAGLTNVTADQHHPQSHVLGGAYHTASGLVAGHVIKATGETSFEWGPLGHSQLASVTANQHHDRDHDFLSAVHPDTVVGSVARGDIIVGNATPKWSKLGKGSVDQFLGSDGTDLVWMHVGWTMVQSKPGTFPPSAHTLASHSSKSHSELSDSPVNAHHDQLHSATHGQAGDDLLKLDDLGTPDDNIDLNASTTRHGLLKKLTGSTTNFLRADGAWSAPTSSAHNLLSAVHTDTGAHNVVRGDLIIGGSGPMWQYLTKGTAGQYLKAGTYEPVWSTLYATDLPAHASRHHSGGADQVNHDSLTGFVPAEHKSLPNTIAQVLSNHTKAIHDSLAINAGSVDGFSASQTRNSINTCAVRDASGYLQLGWINTTSGTAGTTAPTRIYGSNDDYIRYYTPANFATVMKPYFDDHFALIAHSHDHGALSGLGGDDHGQYYNTARHTKAVHTSLGLMPYSGGAFTGAVEAVDHTTAGLDKVVNVAFGTGNPPTPNTTTRGTLFVKYTP